MTGNVGVVAGYFTPLGESPQFLRPRFALTRDLLHPPLQLFATSLHVVHLTGLETGMPFVTFARPVKTRTFRQARCYLDRRSLDARDITVARSWCRRRCGTARPAAHHPRNPHGETRPESSCRRVREAVVLRVDPLAPRTPRLPHHGLGAAHLAASTALHATAVIILALIGATAAPGHDVRQARPTADRDSLDVRRVVFLAPTSPPGRGGGGGGNQRPEPIRRAQGVGTDSITLRVRPRPPAPLLPSAAPVIDDVPPPPSIVLDAKPLASGMFEQIGLPTGGVLSGTSTGPGSGGGVGSGIGTGIGPGRGPGIGPGSGGGTGGGVYRPGGAVSGPRLIKEVKPIYTSQALLDRIQGSVVLEAVVTTDGCASHIRVVRSLNAGGLDQEAVAAVTQWQFEPGRLGGTPVPVLVTIIVDFLIR